MKGYDLMSSNKYNTTWRDDIDYLIRMGIPLDKIQEYLDECKVKEAKRKNIIAVRKNLDLILEDYFDILELNQEDIDNVITILDELERLSLGSAKCANQEEDPMEALRRFADSL